MSLEHWSGRQISDSYSVPGQELIKAIIDLMSNYWNITSIFVINFYVGDVLLSLNKLDLNSSNVHTILAAITGPMEVSTFFWTPPPPSPVSILPGQQF